MDELGKLDAAVDARYDDLVELVPALVRLDTTAVDLSPGSDHTENEEARVPGGRSPGACVRPGPRSTSGNPTPMRSAATR